MLPYAALWAVIKYACSFSLWDTISRFMQWLVSPSGLAAIIIGVLQFIISTIEWALPAEAATALGDFVDWLDTAGQPLIRIGVWALDQFMFSSVAIALVALSLLALPTALTVRLTSFIISRIWGGGSN